MSVLAENINISDSLLHIPTVNEAKHIYKKREKRTSKIK